jgi:hypothetical protein
MEKYVYRFRSTSALLGEFQELEKQEIYFASPQELNDPLEGLKDIFWQGDAIVWTNLVRHYLLCLMQAVLTAIEHGPDHQFADHDIPVLLTEEGLTPSGRPLFQTICTKFFENEEVVQLPALLAARISPIRRNELLSLFWFIHFHALKITCMVISPQEPICLIDEFLRSKKEAPFRFQQSFAAQNALDQKYGNSGDLAEQMSTEATSLMMQAILIRDYQGSSQHHGPAWNKISSAFPEVYIDQLERLLYSDWYTACFVAKPTHAAMWGNYGDGHRGVCLKFRTQPNAAGGDSLMLRKMVGARGNQGAVAPVYDDVPCELHEVQYRDQYVEIDFFRSMGRLTRPQLAFWFRGNKGEISSTGRDLIEESEAWRREYWSNLDRAITTKLSDWQHESEYRVTLYSMMMDFSDRAARKVRYRFEDLRGVIFGIKTPAQDKRAIIRIIESKCRKDGRKDFEFHQSYYSRQTGKIETTQLRLLKFN